MPYPDVKRAQPRPNVRLRFIFGANGGLGIYPPKVDSPPCRVNPW